MNTKVAIWGAGNFGKYVYEQLKQRADIKVTCFVDKKEENWGKCIDGVEVISPQTMVENKPAELVLVAFLNCIKHYEEFAEYKGIKFGFVKNPVFQKQLSLEKELLQDGNIFWTEDCAQPLLMMLETNVVDWCNLNCKGCSHFSNLYHKGDMVPYDSFCRDLAQMAQHVNVYRLNLLGGETLLHDRLTEYMEYSRKVLPYAEIRVITNGLLLLKQNDTFFQNCKKYNIGIDISEYKPTSAIVDKIEALLQEQCIAYTVRDNKGDFGKNIDLTGQTDKLWAMQHCRESECHFFRNGKLYKCPFEVLGNKFFEHYNLDIRLEGGVDIFDPNLDWAEAMCAINYKPVDAC